MIKKNVMRVLVILLILNSYPIDFVRAYGDKQHQNQSLDWNYEEEVEKYSSKVMNKYNNTPNYPKEVFLTFDDGPTTDSTIKILKILNDNNVKATFFLVGNRIKAYPNIVKEIYNSGMCIEPHGYSHDYRVVYKSTEDYFKDLDMCIEAINTVTQGENLYFIRMPGGSDNQVTQRKKLREIRKKLNDSGIQYVDWNVSSGDAAAGTVPKDVIVKNVIGQCKYNKFAVVLMHDSSVKTTTVEALPEIISYLKAEGYVFRTFSDITPKEESMMKKLGIVNRPS